MASKDNAERVWDAIEDNRLCMLTSKDGAKLRARPMAAYPDRDAGHLWFFTDSRAHKDDEIAKNPEVCVAFANPKSNVFVSVSGRAEVRRDKAKVHELWSTELQAWFPNGPDDPSVVLLLVTPADAEIWEGTSSTLVYAFEAARAAITGTRPNVGDNAKVRM